MACDSIYRTPINFENALYKPGNMDTLIDAIHDMGFQFDAGVQLFRKHMPKGVSLMIWPKDEYRRLENTVTYRDGQFRIPDTLGDRFSLTRVQNAYGMQTAKQTAKKNGWNFTQTSETEFEFRQR
jgi:hypothetical protein